MPSGDAWAVPGRALTVRGAAVGDHDQHAQAVSLQKRHAAGTLSGCSAWRSNLTSHPSLGTESLYPDCDRKLQVANCKLHNLPGEISHSFTSSTSADMLC